MPGSPVSPLANAKTPENPPCPAARAAGSFRPVELRQLRYFCAVAEELSFARAARRLFIAQPALSVQIRNLEDELKVPLLRRTTRSVEVTHAGKTFYADAREILARVESAAKHAQDAEHGVVGTLRVGFLSNVATAELGARMRGFSDRFPHVNLTLAEASTHQQVALLRRGDLDVGLLRISRSRERRPARGDASSPLGAAELAVGVGFSSEELASMEVNREPMIVAVPAESGLAHKKRLAWQDFHRRPMIGTSDARERYFEPFFTCCERAGVQPDVTQHAPDLTTRLWMVACGFGFTPTSESSREIMRPGLCYRPLPPDGPEVLTFAAWRRDDPAPHLLQFIEILKTPVLLASSPFVAKSSQ